MTFTLTWNPSELREIQPRLDLMENGFDGRHSAPPSDKIMMSAAEAIRFNSGLSCSCLGLPVRHILSKIGFDEKRVFDWRVEHKLVQALILQKYCGSAVPVSCGLNSLLLNCGYSSLSQLLSVRHSSDLILKRTLGYNSDPDQSHELNRAIIIDAIHCYESGNLPEVGLEGERFIVQQRVPIESEYRVHTIEDKVIAGITYRKGNRINGASGDCAGANSFVRNMLDRLPNALVKDTLCGWDVVYTYNREWRIIEINYAGFHPVFEQGFHCSGYFQDLNWGFARTAELLHFIEKEYAVQITLMAGLNPDHSLAALYSWIGNALELLRERDRLENLTQEFESAPVPSLMIGKEEIKLAAIDELKQYAQRLKTLLSETYKIVK